MKFALLLVVVLLASCRDAPPANMPDPVNITAQSTAHFCGMAISEMPGPKAEVILKGAIKGAPTILFFAQVRDGIAYMKQPERTARILAFYVSDMARAKSWDQPGADNWTDGKKAFYVVGAAVKGGMGAPEVAPFGTRADAEKFAREKGGAVMHLGAIPESAVLGAVEHPEMDMKGNSEI